MRGEAAGRGRECVRGKRTESGRSSADPRGTQRRPRSSEDGTRLKEVLLTVSGSEKQTGGPPLQGDGGGDGNSRRKARKAELKGGDADDDTRELRWRLNRLEKEKLELTSRHNQEVCGLEAELARLRAAVERGEAERAQLQYELSVRLRETETEVQRIGELQREKHALTERQAELEQNLSNLGKALDLTRRGRDQDQQSLQQEVDERDRLIQGLSQDNGKLHRLLMDQEQALEQSEQRITELQREVEKGAELNRCHAQREAELKHRHADELRYLSDREERLRADKEFAEQRIRSLEANIEAERAAHLESKFNSEIVQLRLRDLEAALAVERSSLQEATCGAEQLRAHLRQTEKQREQEQQRGSQARAQLHRLQQELEQCKSDMGAALDTEKRTTSDLSAALEAERALTSDLRERLEDEKRRHESATSQLQQVTEERSQTQEAFKKFVRDMKETLQQHSGEDSGSWSPDEAVKKLKSTLSAQTQRQEEANKQIEDLLFASEQLLDENKRLKEQSSKQKTQVEECERSMVTLRQEVTRMQTEGSDWSNLSRQLGAELQRERDERKRERDRAEEEVRTIKGQRREEEEARLSAVLGLLQRLQPQSIVGNLSWDELWFRVGERVEQMNSDFHQAKHQVSSLQSVLSRLEDKVRKREQDWSRKHQQTVAQLHRDLQSSRSECQALRGHVTSLTSDLSSLCNESARFQWACLLLGGALTHSQVCVQRLSEQKALLCRRLAEWEAVEQEVRSLAAALEADDEADAAEEEEEKKRALRRWRRVVSAVMALRKWCMMGKSSPVVFRLQAGGGASAVGVSLWGDATGRREGHDDDKETEPLEIRFTQWLRSKRLSTLVLSSMSDLQGALSGSGSSPQSVMSAAQSGLSRLLGHLLGQSDAAPAISKQNGPMRPATAQPHMKELVSRLQQHFLSFSQRLHSTEVERRSLRLELNKLRRAAKKRELDEANSMVPSERFHAVCSELREALGREQEAQSLVRELNSQLNDLRTRVDSFSTEKTQTQESLDQTAQFLSAARRELCRKERSLRILGKHLSAVQKERRQLEERLRETQDELQNAAKQKEQLIETMKAAEKNCTQLRESLVQSHRSLLCSKPHPLTLPESLSGSESIMGDAGAAACQGLLCSVALLSQTFSSRVDWLEREVSAHQSHVTALRSELQDACLRQNQAFTSVAVFPDFPPLVDIDASQPVPLCDSPTHNITTT